MTVVRSIAGLCVALAIVAFLPQGTARAQLTDAEFAALQEQAAAEGWSFELRRTNASLRAPEELYGLELPAPDDAYWETVPKGGPSQRKDDPPASWDWRALGGVTAVKNQGSCGSCWAFSTIGVVESAIKIEDGIEEDLSEQHILSCNTAGWGCSGATWGYAWLIGTPDACGYVGAAFEADYPYQAIRWEVRLRGAARLPAQKLQLRERSPAASGRHQARADGARSAGLLALCKLGVQRLRRRRLQRGRRSRRFRHQPRHHDRRLGWTPRAPAACGSSKTHGTPIGARRASAISSTAAISWVTPPTTWSTRAAAWVSR